MTQTKWLYQLQQLDLEIDAATEALGRVEAQLGDRQALKEVEHVIEGKRRELAELESQQRHAEWEAQDQGTKLSAVEQKLYGGSVRNPKELAGLQQDSEFLRKHYKDMEDRALALMLESDSRKHDIANDVQQLTRMEGEWREEQARLSQEQASLKATLDSLAQRRRELLVRVDHRDLEVYQALRLSKQGKAVARVEQGMCQGCRIHLPSNDLKLVRAGNTLVQCSSCQRILYME